MRTDGDITISHGEETSARAITIDFEASVPRAGQDKAQLRRRTVVHDHRNHRFAVKGAGNQDDLPELQTNSIPSHDAAVDVEPDADILQKRRNRAKRLPFPLFSLYRK